MPNPKRKEKLNRYISIRWLHFSAYEPNQEDNDEDEDEVIN